MPLQTQDNQFGFTQDSSIIGATDVYAQVSKTILSIGFTDTPAVASDGLDGLGFAHQSPYQIEGQMCGCCGAQIISAADLLDLSGFSSTGPIAPATNVNIPAPAANMVTGNFDFSVTVANDSGDAAFDDFIADVQAVTEKALSNWSQYITGATGSSLEVSVTIEELSENTVASAGAGTFVQDEVDANGVRIFSPGTQRELTTGNDPNGLNADINIRVNTGFLEGTTAFFETGDDREVPSGFIDFVSVLTHEVGHGLGIAGFYEADGLQPTFDFGSGPEDIFAQYDALIEFDGDGVPFFTGDTVQSLYGEKVALEFQAGPGSDISHVSGRAIAGVPFDFRLALMNPSVVSGDVTTIGAIELAILQDIGYTNITIPTDLGLSNELDSLPFDPTVSVDANTTISEAGLSVGFTLSQANLFTTVESSIGYGVSLNGGQTVTGRAGFATDGTTSTELLDLSALSTIFTPDENGVVNFVGGSVDVQLFYGLQVDLANGTNFQDFTVNVDAFGIGTDGDDTFDGNSGDDLLFGGIGADTINGLGGRDEIDGGVGDDNLAGGNGRDTIFGSAGLDQIFGGSGADRLEGGDDNDVISGDDGRDTIFGDAGDDELSGSEGADTLRGGDGSDTLNGGVDGDFLFGGVGNDILNGDEGDDRLFGGGQDDTLNGGTQDDRLFGDNGDDILNGDAGSDTLRGGGRNDQLNGGADNDFLFGGSQNDTLNGGAGNDQLRGDTGSDIFVFDNSFGTDELIDFDALDDSEKIDLSAVTNITDFNDLINNHIDTSTGAVRIIDGVDSIILTGVNLADLDANDFIFSV